MKKTVYNLEHIDIVDFDNVKEVTIWAEGEAVGGYRPYVNETCEDVRDGVHRDLAYTMREFRGAVVTFTVDYK